ncbi:hypothetical protein CFS9_14170 [Flavobacterium sp. CFS9]|uniref:Uncharacterized protein n=1 Tax=Flavobacterium sp. CFS9 TaxID=3143118 RepID=A0AAT9GZU8_9FLAO
MKTNSTSISAKKGICNLVIFLTAVQISYSLVSHFIYGKPQSDSMVIVICVLLATFASSKKEEYSKQ